MAFSLWCCSVPMIWNFNDTHSTNGERRFYTYSVCGEAALCIERAANHFAEVDNFRDAGIRIDGGGFPVNRRDERTGRSHGPGEESNPVLAAVPLAVRQVQIRSRLLRQSVILAVHDQTGHSRPGAVCLNPAPDRVAAS